MIDNQNHLFYDLTILTQQKESMMTKIQKVSRYFLISFKILLILLPLCALIQWLFIDTTPMKTLMDLGLIQAAISTPEGYVSLGTVHWTILAKFVGFIAQSLGLLPLFLSLFALKSVFQNYQKGEIFNTMNARSYRYLGCLFFLYALIVEPLSNLLMVLAVTLTNPPGHRYITLAFGTLNLEALYCGMLVIVISWVMLEASKLRDEQELTI